MLQNASPSTQGLQILEPFCHRVNFDFEAIIDEVAPYLANHDSLADVKTFAKAFPGWLNLEAAISHLQLIENYHKKIKRLAIVSDNGLLAALPKFAPNLLHPDVKHFSESEYDDSLQWLQEIASPANRQQSVQMS